MAKPSRGRRSTSASGSSSRSSSRSRSRSGSRSLWRSRSRSRSVSSSSSPSRSVSSGSRSPPPRGKSLAGPARRGRSPPPPQSKGASSPSRKATPIEESLVLYINHLSRNVNEGHLKEIFGNFGEVVHVELVIDRAVNLPRGSAYVEFKARANAEKAQLFMDGGQVDGNVVKASFTLPPRQKVSEPPKPVSSAPKRDAPKSDNAGVDIEKDGPRRPREILSPKRRSPLPRNGASPRRLPDSPPRRRLGSPVRRHGDIPPRRRPASPSRGRSPTSPPPRRYRSPPSGSPRRIRGSPVRRRSPPPLRRRSPLKRVRSPPRRSPIRRRSRSPIRRPGRSRSRSISPRKGRGPAGRRGRSSSYSSSPSPRRISRKISRSCSPKREGPSSRLDAIGRNYTISTTLKCTMLKKLEARVLCDLCLMYCISCCDIIKLDKVVVQPNLGVPRKAANRVARCSKTSPAL